MPSEEKACPRHCYSTCTLTVTAEGGRLVAVAGGLRATAPPPKVHV